MCCLSLIVPPLAHAASYQLLTPMNYVASRPLLSHIHMYCLPLIVQPLARAAVDFPAGQLHSGDESQLALAGGLA